MERTVSAAWASTMAHAGDTLAADAEGEESGQLAAGACLGRYVIVGLLGKGGMGVVHAGYDPELDRRVALKLLYRAGNGEEARMRTLREAQAMARLQHPNVVAIHDVGTADERVWLAMEYVEGVTLRQWLRGGGRGWRAVLEVMLAAARGLAAAHAAGLVHRDIKPENIMIGADGRVRVMDFGLARAGEAAIVTQPISRVSGSSLLKSDLTVAGSLLGTPVYMAPEVLLGGAGDVRADVFSWCVTCWEALFGQRPFAGETLDELRRNVGAGKRRAPPADRTLPAGLRRALERGLEVLPAGRHASFEQLLAAVEGSLRGLRWRRAGLVALAAGAVAAVAIGARMVAAQATEDRCAAEGAEIAGLWSEEAADRIAGVFAASGVVNAGEVLARTRPWLDAYAERWADARRGLCLASARGDASPAVVDGLACLDERRAGFAVLVEEVLAKPDTGTLSRAVAAASRLPAPAQCLDAGWLAHTPRGPEEPEVRARIAGVRAQIERSASLERASEYSEARVLAEAALVEAEAIGWAPLIAQARLRGGSLAMMRGEYAAAEAALEQVVWQAEAAGHDTLVAEATHQLTFTVGVGLGRPAEAIRWGQLGVAVLRRIGEEESPAASDNYAALAIVEEARGDFAASRVLKEKLLALRERHLGPEHPSVANALNMMGILHLQEGDLEASLRAHERALKIRLATFGPEHMEVAMSQINLGEVRRGRGEAAQCVELERAAQRVIAAIHGAEHPDMASSLVILGFCEKDLGDLTGALRDHRAALAIRERVYGKEHPLLGVSHAGVGEVLLIQGDVAGAIAEFEAAVERFEAAFGKDDPNIAEMLLALAVARRMTGESALALASLERAEGIRRMHVLPAHSAALILGELVRALWEAGDEASRTRARGLAQEATLALRDAKVMGVHDSVEELRGWLATHAEELRG